MWYRPSRAQTDADPGTNCPVLDQNVRFTSVGGSAGGDTSALAYYYAQVREAMYAVWRQPSGAGASGIRTQVRVKVLRGGGVVSRQLVSGSGSSVMDASVMNAVQSVSRLPPLPADVSGDSLEIVVEFVLEGHDRFGFCWSVTPWVRRFPPIDLRGEIFMKKQWLVMLVVVLLWPGPQVEAQVRVVKGAGEKSSMDWSAFNAGADAVAQTFFKTLTDDLLRSGWFKRGAPGSSEFALTGRRPGGWAARPGHRVWAGGGPPVAGQKLTWRMLRGRGGWPIRWRMKSSKR
jgi:TonB family protein